MGTYLYLGKITGSRLADAIICVSDEKKDYIYYNEDYQFLGSMPSNLIDNADVIKHIGYEWIIDNEKSKILENIAMEECVISNNQTNKVDVSEAKICYLIATNSEIKISSLEGLETDFYQEPFILTTENIEKYKKDILQTTDDIEEVEDYIEILDSISKEIKSGIVWYNFNSEKRY